MSAKPALEPTRDPEEHPSPETLAAYHAGQLGTDQEEALRDHLALCPACAEMLLDLLSFAAFTPPGETSILSDSEVESAWQKVQPRLMEREATDETPAPVVPIRERRREAEKGDVVPWRRLAQAYALAASLFVGVVGLSVWGISLQRRVNESAKPKVDVPITDLLPDGEGTRGKESVTSASPKGSLVVLHLLDLPRKAEYSAVLVDRSNRIVWASPALHHISEDVLTFERPEGLRAGEHRILLYAVEKGHRELLAQFRLQVPPGS